MLLAHDCTWQYGQVDKCRSLHERATWSPPRPATLRHARLLRLTVVLLLLHVLLSFTILLDGGLQKCYFFSILYYEHWQSYWVLIVRCTRPLAPRSATTVWAGPAGIHMLQIYFDNGARQFFFFPFKSLRHLKVCISVPIKIMITIIYYIFYILH